MANQIKYLGNVKMPFDSMIKLTKKSGTRVDATFDTERSSYHKNRNKTELAFSKKIQKLYGPNKSVCYFYRYTNPRLSEIIPTSFWKKYKMDKNEARVQILHHPPGTVSIPHIDRYDSMMRDSGISKNTQKDKKVCRLWIAMTDPKLGHALFVGSDVAYNLKKGTILTFNKNIPHSGCNVGYDDRYVLTVTGFHG
tara:strand:+ start:4406 stop:4990 length:585 start_codon:yes stop_codon:yes gene_type:complete